MRRGHYDISCAYYSVELLFFVLFCTQSRELVACGAIIVIGTRIKIAKERREKTNLL